MVGSLSALPPRVAIGQNDGFDLMDGKRRFAVGRERRDGNGAKRNGNDEKGMEGNNLDCF